MRLKKTLLKNGLLYVILDNQIIEENNLDIFDLAGKLSRYGTDIFQFRFKKITDKKALTTAGKLSKMIRKAKKRFIINDRADIAYLTKADGVHLGKDDISPKQARKILGRDKIVGKTVHSPEEFQKFKGEPVNYLSLGPVFKTKLKPELPCWELTELKNFFSKRNFLFAIGGIKLDNIGLLLKENIRNVVVCRELILSGNLKKTTEGFKQCLAKNS